MSDTDFATERRALQDEVDFSRARTNRYGATLSAVGEALAAATGEPGIPMVDAVALLLARAERAEAALERVTAALKRAAGWHHENNVNHQPIPFERCAVLSCVEARAALASIPQGEAT